MIVVKILLWPHGDHTRERVLSVGTIALTKVSRDGDRAYNVCLYKDTQFGGPDGSDPDEVHCPEPRRIWRSGMVSGHLPGRRGVWDLLAAAVWACVGNRLRDYRRGPE